jgi:hemerythrin superfamily protein
MKVTDLLQQDHRKVEDLAGKIEESSGAEQATLASQIIAELKAHTEAEEHVLYPGIRDEVGDDLVDESIEEHHVVDVLIGEMDPLEVGSDEWMAKFTVMKENVEHHVEEEEQEMFPDLEEKLGDERLEQLGDELARFKLRYQLDQHTKDELLDLARDANLDGTSDMTKDDLVEALCEAGVPVPA